MKKNLLRTLILVAIPASFLISGCNTDKNEGKFDFEYYMFNMSSNLEQYEAYFLINDTETKVFSSANELNDFDQLLRNFCNDSQYLEQNAFFDAEVNFSTSKVAITAMYSPHTYSDFEVSSLVADTNKIYQTINHNINTPSTASSTYGFLYTILDKDDSREFSNRFIQNENYDRYACYKPVIYFYPEYEMDFKLEYVNSDRLITTYPKYDNGWNLRLHEDSTFNVIGEERNYYALYFDESNYYNVDFSTGFYVTKDSAITFLEEKLAVLGYSERESNEFIMYWLPVLEENEQSLVYFEQTKERNNECPLNYSVQPDSILRTIIHIKKVDSFKQVEPQKLDSFSRSGFSLVEWGGIIY